MSAIYEAPKTVEMRMAGGYIRDGVESIAADGTPGLQLSSDPANLAGKAYTSSAFGLFQVIQQIHPVGVTVGGRYESTSFGKTFAPRAGLTYVQQAFNATLLY